MPKLHTSNDAQEIFLPLQQDIGKALEAFAKARGITVIVDGSQVPVVYAADSIDITKAFIADFNSKNPATASVTTTIAYRMPLLLQESKASESHRGLNGQIMSRHFLLSTLCC